MRSFAQCVVLIAVLTLSACSDRDAAQSSASEPPTAAVSTGFSADSLTALSQYEVQALALVERLSGDAAVDADDINHRAEDLVAIATGIVPDFLRLQPHCRSYLEATQTLIGSWRELGSAAIEAGYHKDGALPKIDNAAACYHMKDLIVHPISAQALIAEDTGNRAPARREIEEVLAHLSVVRATRG